MFSNYREENRKRYRSISNPYWKRIGEIIDFPKEIPDYNKDIVREKNFNLNTNIDELYFKYIDFLEIDDNFALGEKFLRFSESYSNTGFFIDTEKDKLENKSKIDFIIDEENPILISHNLIICRENSELDIFIHYTDNGKITGFHNGFTKIYVGKGAKLNIYKVQDYLKPINYFDSNTIYVEDDGEVNIVDVQLGSKLKGTSYDVGLKGDRSLIDIKAIYLGTEKDKMDFSYDIDYIGRESKGYVEVVGALTDEARKVFRSTENFVRGSKRSEGDAREYATLLDKRVRSHAIPALFTTEDDVIGNHAASAGHIDGNKMFYLMSRGLDEETAKILVVESTFEPILGHLPDEQMKENILNFVKDRLGGK